MESCLDGLGPQMAQVQCCRLPTPPLTGNPAPGGQKVHRRPGSTDGLGPQTAQVHRWPRSTDGPVGMAEEVVYLDWLEMAEDFMGYTSTAHCGSRVDG